MARGFVVYTHCNQRGVVRPVRGHSNRINAKTLDINSTQLKSSSTATAPNRKMYSVPTARACKQDRNAKMAIYCLCEIMTKMRIYMKHQIGRNDGTNRTSHSTDRKYSIRASRSRIKFTKKAKLVKLSLA